MLAAFRARHAILNTRTDGDWKPAVEEFARTWLSIAKVTQDWLEAVSTALLGSWADQLDALHLDCLSKEARSVHRQLQPLWGRKAYGERLLSLDYTSTGGATLHDLLAAPHTPESLLLADEFKNPRVAAVLSRLKKAEEALARDWAYLGQSWEKSAQEAGERVAFGERVRCKLKRLGNQHTARAAAAAAWKTERP